MRCKKCMYWRKIYIHPWSKNIPEELKGSWNGFACVLPNDEEFQNSFGGDNPELFVDVLIGMEDCGGCENFTEVEDEL